MEEKDSLSFFALLRAIDGETLCEGMARMTADRNSIILTSDFVPLYPVDTAMEIVRIEDGVTIHRFAGTVSLSAKTVMILTILHDHFNGEMDFLFQNEIPFQAVVEKIDTTRKRWVFARKKNRTPTLYEVGIQGLTDQCLVFTCDSKLEFVPGEQVILNAETLKCLPTVTLLIDKVFPFGINAAQICSYRDMSETNAETLRRSLLRYPLKRSPLLAEITLG